MEFVLERISHQILAAYEAENSDVVVIIDYSKISKDLNECYAHIVCSLGAKIKRKMYKTKKNRKKVILTPAASGFL